MLPVLVINTATSSEASIRWHWTELSGFEYKVQAAASLLFLYPRRNELLLSHLRCGPLTAVKGNISSSGLVELLSDGGLQRRYMIIIPHTLIMDRGQLQGKYSLLGIM